MVGERPDHQGRARTSVALSMVFMRTAITLFLVGLSAFCYAADPSPPRTTKERQLDQRIVGLLAEESELIIVGEVVRQNPVNSRYGVVLLKAECPFEVKTLKVLKGECSEGRVLKVGVTRDEPFLYKEGGKCLFFLKRDDQQGKPFADPLMKREWRSVADYIGIHPHSTALERMAAQSSAR